MKNYLLIMLGMVLGIVLWQQAPRLIHSADTQPPANLLRFSSTLMTSGQPTSEQMSYLLSQDIDVVINLSPADSFGSIDDEAYLVSSMGMKYVNIPVDWYEPKLEDFVFFNNLLLAQQQNRFFVHCQVNKRAAIFAALFQLVNHLEEEQSVYKKLHSVITPEGQWEVFMREVIHHFEEEQKQAEPPPQLDEELQQDAGEVLTPEGQFQ